MLTYVPDLVAEWLSDMNEFSGCHFTTLYPSVNKSIPVEKTTVVLSMGNFLISKTENTTMPENSRAISYDINITIFAPLNQGADICIDTLERIYDQLIFNSPLDITSVKCERAVYDKMIEAIALRATVTVADTITKGEYYPAALIIK